MHRRGELFPFVFVVHFHQSTSANLSKQNKMRKKKEKQCSKVGLVSFLKENAISRNLVPNQNNKTNHKLLIENDI